jgi:Family of unknown function (DUF6350)
MTDLLNRPSATSASTRPPTSRLGRVLGALRGRPTDGSGPGDPEARPLNVSAAIAALAAAATTMVTFMAVAVIGWFLADAGAHGQTTDALRVGADVWLVGHGSGLTVSGVPLGMVPLTLTGLILAVVYRYGRWAAESSQVVDDDRTLGVAATVFSGLYMVIAVVTCVLVGQEAASPGLGRAIVGSMLVAGVAGTLGMAVGSGRLSVWVPRVPGWVRSVAYGATASFLLLLVASAVLVAAMVMLGLNQSASMMTGLDLAPGDYVMYTLATMAVAPNAVLFGGAYLLGPGFAVGTGTVVSPTVVSLGPMPAFPLLAALPDTGPTPEWALGFMAVPVLVGMVGAVLAQRAYRVAAYDSSALRGFGCGFGAALLSTLAIALAGGPMGTGRMADIGAPLGEVLVSSVAAMSLGGLVAGLVTAWWQRRRGPHRTT